MPPNFTCPARLLGSSPLMFSTSPGIARHMLFLRLSRLRKLWCPPARCHDLTERDTPVVGGHTLVPVRAKALFPQAGNCSLGQVSVLEAAPGEHHLLLTHEPCNLNNYLR